MKNEGYAVIIITHRMSEIMAISDRVTILRDGKKVKELVTAETNPTELSIHMIGRELHGDFFPGDGLTFLPFFAKVRPRRGYSSSVERRLPKP